MGNGIFIAGTDTGIGKTYVAEGLIRAMKAKGIAVCPMKPFETGCRMKKGELVPEDALRLMSVSGIDEPLSALNPCRFRHPLAPSVAAEVEGARIRRRDILSAYTGLSKKYDMTVVEGAGGIMVPVYKKYLFLDFIKDLALPVVIVSRPGLGTINHTLLTIHVLRHEGVKVLGVIFNYAVNTGKGIAEKTNPEVVERLGRVPALGTVPYKVNMKNHSSEKIFNGILKNILLRL